MSTATDLAVLQRVPDLRSVWKHEARDFTKWLSEEDNLALLGDTIGLELELVETESSVGSFNADVVALEVGTDRKVIIENQLEDSNHSHLGQIITYASGKDASVVIWIVSKARDEHAQAIDWLNAHTDENIGFFLLEIELWQIGDSPPAPRFNVVERPNEWGKSIKQAEGLTKAQKAQLAYWLEYNSIARQTPDFLKLFSPQKARAQHWTNLAIGSSAYHMNLLVNTQKKRIGVEFNISDDKSIYERVKKDLEDYAQEQGLAYSLWGAKTKSSGIQIFKEKCDIKKDTDKWGAFIAWQMDAAVHLRKKLATLGL
jgi:hypothetical protein